MGNNYQSLTDTHSEIEQLRRENRKLKNELFALKNEVSPYWDVVTVLRFRWYLPGDDVHFEGHAIVKLKGENYKPDENGFPYDDQGACEVQILVCFRHEGGKVFPWQPYGKDFDKLITPALDIAAIEAYDNPPGLAVVFPGEK